MAATPPAHRKFHGSSCWCAAGACEVVEGRGRSRNVLREFPDYADRARLLPLARVPAREAAAAAALDLRFRDRRRLRRRRSRNSRRRVARGRARARATGSPTSMSPIPRATRPTWPPTWRAVRQVRRTLPGARRHARGGGRQGRARAPWCSNSRAIEAALDCYRSPEYQAAAALRKGKAEVDLVVVEGYDGPQS